MLGIIAYVLFLFIVLLYYKVFKIKILDPISIILTFNFIFPCLVYPLLKASSMSTGNEALFFFDEIFEILLLMAVVFVFWAIGVSVIKRKVFFKPSRIKFRHNDHYFAYFIFIVGFFLFVSTFLLAGINFFSAFSNPLATRASIINTTGAYHIRNFALWFLWTGWFLLLCLRIQFNNVSFIKLALLFLFIIFLSIPLGQRYQLIFPIIFLLLFLNYFNIVKPSKILVTSLPLVILLPIFALYREIGNSDLGFNFEIFLDNLGSLVDDRNAIFYVISERFENIMWLKKFWIARDSFDMSFIDSLKGFVSNFLPASLVGADKGLDVDVYLTRQIVGSQDFGTTSFTAVPEWYMNFGYLGIPMMSFFSGIVVSLIQRNIKSIGLSIFSLSLFSDGFFLKVPFVNFNSNGNVSILYHLIFACAVLILYKLYVTIFNSSDSNCLAPKTS